ncbi:TonB-dependent receptor [Henriciella barbarensis]|uniref:TonB-dependent receptor n=1 Tax=Henriciella barbarensis TaxID=86342 RepID=A0A399R1Q2_9PROT|nr:TonB-dependent receptor [Henriciella barbarensis]RIJ23787.1 TonB-dependent receptor [Henriciella barbarensis]
MKTTNKWLLATSVFALSAAGAAYAQEDGDDDTLRQQTVTVTGSAIAGTPEDAALPVDVLTAGDLQLEGSPTITELIRNLGVSSGTDSQTNQFASNGLEGTSNINLRGLGPARTLVLINGRRQTFHPYAIGEQAQLFVDTNMIPTAAVGRIEVLKDGAAAIYGSDAIAGVVNFITRDDFEGFEVGGDYSTFEGTDGNYNINATYGLQGENWGWVTSVGYNKRSEVSLLEKDWAIVPFSENPVGGWSSLSNPGYYVPLGFTGTGVGPIAGAVGDNGCTDVGGIVVGTCRFQFTQFDNLVEEEERYQVFSEYNREFANGVNMHLEALYGYSDVPEWKTSPSYPPQVLTNQVVPASHPGFAQYRADNPTAFPAGTLAALYIGRSFGWGGFPGTGGAQEGFRTYESYRLGGQFDGQFSNGVNWDTALTWSQTEGERITNDTYINGLTIALQGFGVCGDANTGAIPAGAVAGQGDCEYYNPFSNAIQSSAITGQANPNYVPGLENSSTLAEWMTDGVGSVVTTNLTVFDATLSGLSGVQAAGGEIGWAAGVQVRRESYEVDPNEVTDLTQNPGPGGTGPFSFLAGTTPFDESQTIYAAFGELQVPLFEDVDMQFAVRYEDYGGDVGSTFDPKVAAKWQVSDGFALRGSAQSSFRGPTLNQLSGQVTTLQFVAPTSAFKAVDQFGNPQLDPESAFSFNFGALFDNGNGFTASADYYNFDFKDPIIVEDQASIVGAALAAIAAGNQQAAILNRVTFTDNNSNGINEPNEIARITTNVVNGPDIQTSGIDLRAEQVWDAGRGEFTLGGEATYVFEYDVDDFQIEDAIIPGGDRVDQFNRSNFSRSLPQIKANLFANYMFGNHNIRGVMRYIDSYDDERGDLTGNGNSDIDSQTTFDVFYTWRSDYDLDLGLSVVNVTDEDPPFAQFELNYDPYTHNPFGRTFKISLTKRFGGN